MRVGLPRSRDAALTLFAALLFLGYAINFLYFFVDDEAIAFVYAQNLLRGRGLTYSAFEGPTEGYSNFLHVGVAAVILGVVKALSAPKLAVFAVGKVLSLASGVAIVVLVARALRALFPADWRSQTAALGVLALAGPLAAWSCTSLETAPFALLFTAFALTVILGPQTRPATTVALGTAVLLARIDGFVYVAIAGFCALLAARKDDRRTLIRHVAAPLAAVFVAYTMWRWWYFESLLSLPLQSKVLYKLLPADGVVSNMPAATYLARFLDHYPPSVLVPLSFAWLLFWRRGGDRCPFALLLALGGLTVYVSAVGDWMFGYRFFAALFPLLALLVAYSVAPIVRRAPVVATLVVAAILGWSAVTARGFIRAFEGADRLARWRSWWSDPSLEPARYFAPYYPMYADARSRLPPASVTINNQAGFLPFMLDLENIDDLGICSRFFANLPTADITFTEVGRYHALTDVPPLRAGEAYLVHRDAPYLVSWTHLLQNANNGRLPPTLLAGHFRLAHVSAHQVIYERTRPAAPLRAEDFLENLAHPTRVATAALNGTPVERQAVRGILPFLAGEEGRLPLLGGVQIELHVDADMLHALWIRNTVVDSDAEMALTMHGRDGTLLFRDAVRLRAGEPLRYHRAVENTSHNAVFTMRITPSESQAGNVTIHDLRILGQTPALRDHIGIELFRSPSRGT